MASILVNIGAVRLQNLANQQPEFSVTKHSHACAGWDSYLIQDLAGCGQRFHKHGLLGWNPARHAMQVALGQSQQFPKCARMFHNAKHSPTRAVPAQAFGAPIAGAAPQVDLAHHSLPDQIR